MADHDTAVELFYDGDWQAAPTYTRDSINVGRGAPGEGQDSPPSTAALTLDNRDGNANPRNPTGALYGVAGRNTPMRVSADGSVRSTTEAASWAPQRSLSGTDAWTSVEGGGLLRRLQQGNTPLKSVAYRALMSPDNNATRIAYWPCEEESGATSISSPAGSPTASYAGSVSFGQYTTSPSSARLLTFGAGGLLFFAVPTYSSSEHKVCSLWRLPDAGLTDGSVLLRLYCTGGNVDFIDLLYNTPWTLRLLAYSATTLVDTAVNVDWTGYINGVEFFLSIELTQNGANVDCLVLVVNTATGANGIPTDTLTGVTIGRIFAITVGQTDISEASFGQLVVGNDTTAFPNYISPTNDSLGTRGYTGELAGLRFLRLGEEEGVNTVVVGDETDTQPMGPQPAETLVALLRECVRTDAGLMFEPRDELGVAMRPGRDLYDQDSALDLSFTGGVIAPGLQPILDDRGTRNDVTVKRRNGSSARAVKESGSLNVNDPISDPEGVGRYDTQVDVNTATDDVLYGHATWHLHKGTVDEPRYPQVTVDLDAAPSLVTAVNAVEIGDRITIADMPIDWSPDGANLLVLGVREALPAKRRLVTFVTVPASPYEIALVGDGAAGTIDLRGQAVDSDTLTLGSDVVYNATSFSVASSGLLLTTDSDDWDTGLHGGGLYLVLGGEVVRVTNITGASSPQTVTVVRSINGVVKAHLSTTPIHVRYPAVVGL